MKPSHTPRLPNAGEVEPINPVEARFWSAMSGRRRAAMLDGLCRSAWELIDAGVRAQHPEWSDERVRAETARRFAGNDF